MQLTHSASYLKSAIPGFEIQHMELTPGVKSLPNIIFDRSKHFNPAKNTDMKYSGTNTLKGIVVSSIASVVVGLLIKKLVVRQSPSPMRKRLGALLMLGATHMVSKYADTIGNMGLKAINRLLERKHPGIDADTPHEWR